MKMWSKDFCHAVIDASLYWTGEDEANCPALKYLRTMAGYYLWEQAGRPFPGLTCERQQIKDAERFLQA